MDGARGAENYLGSIPCSALRHVVVEETSLETPGREFCSRRWGRWDLYPYLGVACDSSQAAPDLDFNDRTFQRRHEGDDLGSQGALSESPHDVITAYRS
jgi:hypothetical protein